MRYRSVFGAGLAVCLAVSLAAAPVQAADFRADLTGDQEVPAVETDAMGLALFQFVRVFGQERLITARIDVGLSGPVVGAHIHNAPAGENGPIVLDFANGVILSGVVKLNVNSAADLEGPLQGLTLQDLRALMDEGSTYINVHTEANPDGEIGSGSV